ncbi:GNAT family N-acetyltransferase [Pseudogracilibacillus auburnensis]|uniref:Acetyltransferase (GNAT) family protein n=1 Tax=Pseudogracilibacillus auburnensis TaxID=1494959 RepID=A0A2V3W0N0_9BACI|nr:GNAT family N-acetyltransferase [Pseudogracilibacillus auburnensis]MBO1002760.1 GNAT family N-acetyltransferase [Pseudogracilibacillus auburnensis]PXW87873.1 acetyltransferase (GNAT) family protein [Pseudogracilibacillus auburnensis]
MSKVFETSIAVREIEEEERELVRQLIIESYRQYEHFFEKDRWENYLAELKASVDNEKIDKLLIATNRGNIVGTMQIFLSSDDAYDVPDIQINEPIIRFLAVHPNGRGLGIARKLIDAGIAYTKARKASAIYLHTTDVMEKAVSLYEKYGFVREETQDYVKSGTFIKCYKFTVKN